jgi:hypothetical protein
MPALGIGRVQVQTLPKIVEQTCPKREGLLIVFASETETRPKADPEDRQISVLDYLHNHSGLKRTTYD